MYQGEADQVYSSASFILGANLEDLTLTGAANIDGTGNALSNMITGNEGVNTLSGGAGDDIYYVQTVGDTVIEEALGGYDSVYALADFTMSGNTEYLKLWEGTMAIGDNSDNTIDANHDNNILEGRGGNDSLDGFGGDDTISGGDGNDYIYGGYDQYISDGGFYGNADILDGGAGDDTIDGGSGNDTITGDIGSDILYGGDDDGSEGGDTLSNDDYIDGGEGDDTIDGGSGADTLFGGAGNDTISGGDSDRWSEYYDPITGSFIPMSNDDYLDGGAGDDYLEGQQGNDVLIGEDGADWLVGGLGDDEYHVDGSYTKVSGPFSGLDDCGDTVVLTGERLQWTTDTVIENWDEGYDTVITDASFVMPENVERLVLLFDPAIASTAPQRYADLLAFGQDGTGNDLDNEIIGNELGNRLEGGAGNDTLEGAAGNDMLVGGLGDDILFGGVGDDLYVFRPGDGADVINDWQGSDTLYMGGDLTVADIEASRAGDDLVLSVSYTSDSITVSNWFAQSEGLGRIEFCDNSALNRAGIEGLFNAPPVANADYIFSGEDNAQTVITAATLLANDTDPNAADVLALSGFDTITANGNTVALDANGDLVLDIGDRYQSLSVGQMVTDSFGYSIADNAGATSSATVDIAINGENDAPVVLNTLADQAAQQDAAFNFIIPADTFADIDDGDVLAYTATLSSGAALPDWLIFDVATRTFGGMPGNLDVGNLNVQVTATDTGGLSASGTFSLNIANVNDAPVANADAGSAVENGGAVMLNANVLLANDTDPDFIHGDTLSIAGVTQAVSGAAVSLVDSNVQYDVGKLYQSLAQGQSATDSFTYTVTDSAGATATTEVVMTITGTNDAPVAAISLVDQFATETGSFNYQIPPDSFTDIDQGDTLSYRALLANGSELPSWLGFDATTLTFSGYMPDSAAGLWDVSVVATDTMGARATSSFRLDVANFKAGTHHEDILTGTAFRDVMYGLAEDDYLRGGNADDVLVGGSGNDVLEGGAGNDTLIGDVPEGMMLAGAPVFIEHSGEDCREDHSNTHSRLENNLLNGGSGNDTLIGGAGNDLLIGGAGSDTISTGAGADILAFNWGDGLDTVLASTGNDNTISLGGGITIGDLYLSHVGSDLILQTGASDQITFDDWYASISNHSISNLQIIGNYTGDTRCDSNKKTVHHFDFNQLVENFDSYFVANGTADPWALSNALLNIHLEHSYSGRALGGDLAWQYGMTGSLSAVSLNAAQGELGDEYFGVMPQKLNSASRLDGLVMLG